MRDIGVEPLLTIVGASVRAAAMSARRSGFEVCGLDLFGDADLRGCADWRCIEPYPQQLRVLLPQTPYSPWMYTGGLENHPALVDELAAQRLLYGNGGAVLRWVRDPFWLAECLPDAGLAVPALRRSPEGLPRDGSWLEKPFRSAGGLGIVSWEKNNFPRDPASHYFQKRVAGEPRGAVYVAGLGSARLLGVSRQLLLGAAPDRGYAHGFRYAGSIGPLELEPADWQLLEGVGEMLAATLPLQGLWGIDLMHDGKKWWGLEVNPRYTASVEVLERALEWDAIACHVQACRGEQPSSLLKYSTGCVIARMRSQNSDASRYFASRLELGSRLGEVEKCQDGIFQQAATALPAPRSRRVAGKQILYAERDVPCCPRLWETIEQLNAANPAWPAVADLPVPGSMVRKGMPLLTVLADGENEAEVLRTLDTHAAAIEATYL